MTWSYLYRNFFHLFACFDKMLDILSAVSQFYDFLQEIPVYAKEAHPVVI